MAVTASTIIIIYLAHHPTSSKEFIPLRWLGEEESTVDILSCVCVCGERERDNKVTVDTHLTQYPPSVVLNLRS